MYTSQLGDAEFLYSEMNHRDSISTTRDYSKRARIQIERMKTCTDPDSYDMHFGNFKYYERGLENSLNYLKLLVQRARCDHAFTGRSTTCVRCRHTIKRFF